MKKGLGLGLVLMMAFLMSCVTTSKSTNKKVEKDLYTRVNISYEARKAKKVYSTNYHVGEILPAGTKVHITKLTSKVVFFTVVDTKKEFRLYYLPKFTVVSMDKYVNQMFSDTNEIPKKGFSKKELAAIKAGKIEIGMSKDAVLVSYGYPPAHKTPSLTDNSWRYWINRFRTRIVEFENDKVIKR